MKNSVFNYFGIIMACFAFSASVAQNSVNSELQDFTILIETSNQEIKLNCQEGCDWKELTINKKNFSATQAIDARGFTTIEGYKSKAHAEKNFLFTLKKVGTKIIFKGIDGTKWEELDSNCTGARCLFIINQFGLPI